MPMNYQDYNPGWKEISKGIIWGRAAGKCELCFVPNNTIVWRPNKKYQKGSVYPWYLRIEDKWLKQCRQTTIVLTVHHIDSNKKNDDSLNLLALCQKCHLRLDLAKHIRNRKAKKVKGQLEFSGGGQE